MTVKLPTSENILVKIEDTAVSNGPEKMTDSGDSKKFSSTGTRFSLCEKDESGVDRRPVIRPDGVQNGCLVVPAVSGDDDSVDLYAGKAWVANSLVTVNAFAEIWFARPSASNVKVSSVTVDNTGAWGTVEGTEGSSFSETRGAAGGPPYVPAGKIELVTVRMDSSVSAPLKEDEVIFAPEWSHTPAFLLLPYSAQVRFAAPLSAIHTGDTARDVWISWYEPQLAQLDVIFFRPPTVADDFNPAFERTLPSNPKAGSMTLTLSGDQTDPARKADGTIRLIEFMPDSSAARKELSFCKVELAANYSPTDGLMTGEAALIPAYTPVVETV